MSSNGEVVIDGPKATVGFKRNIRMAEYESAEASLYIEVPTEPGDDLDTVLANAKQTFAAAKSTVFEQLQIPCKVTPEQVVVEALEQKLGAVRVEGAERTDAAAEAKAVATANNTTPEQKGPGKAPKSKEALWQELQDSPKKWFDNSENKKNPKSPDFKRKGTGEGLWLKNQKGESQVPEGVVVPDASAF